MFAEDDLRPISALQHLLFCERQCALIHLEQQWAENALTVKGRQLHQKVDGGRTRRRPGRPATTRSLMLRSLKLGLFGKADVVEFHENGGGTPVAFPVEYKRGKPKPHDADRVQLCAQAMCLEEMLGVSVPAGAIFYGVTRRRLDVSFDHLLRDKTLQTIDRLHALFAGGVTPPARREKKCDACSLVHLCLPEVLLGSEPASRYLSRTLHLTLAESL